MTAGGASEAKDRALPFLENDLHGMGLPFWLLQAYLFLSLSQLAEHYPAIGDLRPLLVLAALVLVSAIGQRLATGREARRGPAIRHAPSAWLLGFAAACVAAWLWAFDEQASGVAIQKYVTTLLVYAFVVLLVRDRRGVQVTALTVAAGVGVFLAMSLWEWFGGRYQVRMGVVRMVGIGSSEAGPNDFAGMLTSAAPLVIWIGTRAKAMWLKAAALAYMLGMSYAIFMTSSRTGMVGWALCIVFALVCLPRKGRIVAIIAGGLGVAALAATLSDSQVARLESMFESNTYDEEPSTVGRVEGYKVAWRIFEEHPWTGVGPGSAMAYRERFVDGVHLQIHSLPGQLISEFGAVGTLAFLGFLASVAAFAWRAARRFRASADPWPRAVSSLGATTLFTLLVLFVTGLAGHNLLRVIWYLLPALLVVAVDTSEPAGADGSGLKPPR